jgi:NADP-dependent aldehyde dehydrogenase
MTLHGKSLIAGTPTETSARTFRAISPLDSNELEPAFHESPLEDVHRALTLAEEAFATYRRVGAEARATFLESIAEEILAIGDDLLQRAHLETGLPLDRLTGERGRTVGQLRLCPAPICGACSFRSVRSWSSARAIFPSPSPSPAATPRAPWPRATRSS